MPEQIRLAILRKFDKERVHPARLNGCAITEPIAGATDKLLDLLNRDEATSLSLRSMPTASTPLA